MKKLAIIGASIGQLELCHTAKRMGLVVICFAWEEGAVCKDVADVFYPISVWEKDRIVEICEIEHVDGVVSNASDLTAEITAYVAEKLGLPGNPYYTVHLLKDKYYVREMTKGIPGLTAVKCVRYQGEVPDSFPCIVKPASGSSKKGVSFVSGIESFSDALLYARLNENPILVEEYVPGREFSVETLSFNGIHYLIQITDKVTSGPPHFVELEHHQPAEFSIMQKQKIESVAYSILNRLNYKNGPAHIEMKIDYKGNLFLIEVNPRSGGDRIADTLVRLSTGYDYLRGIILSALGDFETPIIQNDCGFAGVYFLCQQTERLLPLFNQENTYPWIIERNYDELPLIHSQGNNTRNGFLIYHSRQKVVL